MKRNAFSWSWEIGCLVLFFLMAGTQLFLRPVIGMASNRDFPKALGPLGVCDPDDERDAFEYVTPAYLVDDKCYWDSKLLSSEMLFVGVIRQFTIWSERDRFRITAAGKAHLAVLLIALFVLLWALRGASPPLRFGAPLLLILAFSDVAYIAYLNSFYMDAAALVFLLLTTAIAVAYILRPRWWMAAAFGVSGALFALSKTPHAIAGFLFAGLAVWFAVRNRGPAGNSGEIASARTDNRGRPLWIASAAAIVLAGIVSIVHVPPGYRAEPLYSLLFSRILPDSESPARTLRQFGLPEADLAYSGTHAYTEKTPLAVDRWRLDFLNKLTFGRLMAFYLRNPSVPLDLIEHGLDEEVAAIRPQNIGNYLRREGFPPHSTTTRFAWWSTARSRLLQVFPAHIVLLYAMMGIGALACAFREVWRTRWPLYPLVAILAASGAAEFLLAVLLDGVEISRHFFLFHVISEILIVCAVAALLTAFGSRRTASQAAS